MSGSQISAAGSKAMESGSQISEGMAMLSGAEISMRRSSEMLKVSAGFVIMGKSVRSGL